MTRKSDPLERYAAGIELLREFEGCHLTSYRCPAGWWTIGWGNTSHYDGTPVKEGDQISQKIADEMLSSTIELRILPKLRQIPHWGEMSAEQQGALISFAFNLGWEFYGAEGFETISKRLRDREWAKVPEALLLYRNPGSSFEAGLRRRREAEGKLWRRGMQAAAKPAPSEPAKAAESALFTIEALQNTWLKKKPEQAAALGDREKIAVHTGKSYGVTKLTELAGDAHARVELAAGAGTWHVFLPHWTVDQPGGEALVAEVDWNDFDCLVTPNLTVGEVLQWDRRRIPGPDASVRARLLETAAEFQKIREAWGGGLGVTSFYRPEPINRQVGGVPNSRHVSGRAMDIYPVGRSLEEFYQWIRVRWRGGLGDGRRRGFIHLDTDGGGFVPGGGATPAAEWDY
jgi:GH24 family phage-related lysozyme (muramidase)